jgi:tetratricopeptide (TPR) repeat protein
LKFIGGFIKLKDRQKARVQKKFYLRSAFQRMYFPSYKNTWLQLFFAAVILFSGDGAFASGNRKVDSLYTVLKSTTNDTSKINLRLKIANILLKEDTVTGTNEVKKAFYALNSISDNAFVLRSIDKIARIYNGQGLFYKARFYWETGLRKAKGLQNKEWQAKFYQRIAAYLQGEDYLKQSLLYFDSALAIARTGEPKVLASILMSKGRAHYDMGDYKPAMDHYIEAQRLFEKYKWWNTDYGHLLHFIGSVFKQQDFYEKALDYYQKELKLAQEIKNKGLEGEGYYLCASMYGTMGNLDKELEYLQEAIKIFTEENNLRMLGLMYGNLSANYSDRKEYQKAIESNEKALKMK